MKIKSWAVRLIDSAEESERGRNRRNLLDMSEFSKDLDKGNEERETGGKSSLKASMLQPSSPTAINEKKVFYTWSSRSEVFDRKAEVEIRLIYQDDDDYTKVPMMAPSTNTWEDMASEVKTLMVLDCYNERAEQSGASYDIFLQAILPKFTALEELHWHAAGHNQLNGFRVSSEQGSRGTANSSAMALVVPFWVNLGRHF